jgi:hypothetical protein
MMALTTSARTKLASILSLLSSDHAGERDAAGLAAQRLLKQHNLTWEQALNPPPVERKLPELGTWRQTAARCLQQTGSLRAWEIGFLRDLPGFQRLSVKQRYVLNEIASRVLKDGAR